MNNIQKISFAIVEDDIPTCELLLHLLSQQADLICIGTFHRAKDAIKQIPLIHPEVVLMDLKLGKENGIDVIRTIKPNLPNTLFLVITVFEENEKLFESLKAGASGYIVKSAAPNEYADAIRDLVKGGSPLSPIIARKLINSFQTSTKIEFGNLTARECEILDLLSKGLMYKEVAAQLQISLDTVRTHIRHIYEKLQVNSKTQAINKVLRQ